MKNLRNLLKKLTITMLLAAVLIASPITSSLSILTENANNIITLDGGFLSEIDEF